MNPARIRDAIAESHPVAPLRQPLAEQLCAFATLNDLSPFDIVLWLHDRPRPELSIAHFERWILAPAPPAPAVSANHAERIVAYARQAYRCGLVSLGPLARRTGLDAGVLRPVLTGAAEPSPAVVSAIAAALGVAPRDLYTLAELEELQAPQREIRRVDPSEGLSDSL